MPRFEKLEGDQRFGIAMPNIQAALFGVSRIDQDKTGLATLYYTDETTESALLLSSKGAIVNEVV